MDVEDAKKIISSAIDSEVEAYTYYTSAYLKATDPAFKKLLFHYKVEVRKTQQRLSLRCRMIKRSTSFNAQFFEFLPTRLGLTG